MPLSRLLIGSAIVLCMLQAGCVALPVVPAKVEPVSEDNVLRVHAMWENRVFIAQDTVHNGKPLPGVAGRIWCFGPNDCTLRPRGELTVDLYDAAPAAKGNAPQLLERWVIDPSTFERLARKGVLGWEYTVFLPWASYKPETRDIVLQAKFAPEKGPALFTPQSTVNLLPPDHGPTVQQHTIRPSRPLEPQTTQPLQVERLPWTR